MDLIQAIIIAIIEGLTEYLPVSSTAHMIFTSSFFGIQEDEFDNFNEKWLFNPSDIDILVLSHAHIDHAGRIPKLVKDGFNGKIYCTSATRDLSAIMLLDSAHIQETDAKYEAKKKHKTITPLYTEQDAKKCLNNFICIEYNNWFSINNDVQLMFTDAGHILGSAAVTLKINENNNEKLVLK